MINKASVNQARSLYYGFLSKMFVFTIDKNRFKGILEAINVMIDNPLDENSAEALKELKHLYLEEGEGALIQEYDDIFHNPSYRIVRNTASYYDEGLESGRKQLEVKNFLAKTRIRRDEKHFKENEDSVGFIVTFMHDIIELILSNQREYDTLAHCLFTEIINPFIDEFIVNVYEHPKARAYKAVAIVMNAFIAFERLYFEVAQPPFREKNRVARAQPLEVVSGAEARRRAENKAKRDADKAAKKLTSHA